jgi:aminopeptidase N
VAIHAARRSLETAIAAALGDRLEALHAGNAVPGPYTPDAAAAGHRALRARALALLSARDPADRHAEAQFAGADNMTERMAALTMLVAHGRAEPALDEFRAAWRTDRLVMDKWFAVQATFAPPASAADTVAALSAHDDFDWTNPNRFRALIGAFAMGNPAGFHRLDGAGYALLVDWLLRLDPINPQTTARLTSAFGNWRIFDATRQALMRAQLERLAALPGLSRDSGEMVERLLSPPER